MLICQLKWKKMMNIESIPVDLKFENMVKGELVILKAKYDDNDYARVYKIMKVKGDLFSVEVISEKPINKDKYSQAHATGKSLIGHVYENASQQCFQPYM